MQGGHARAQQVTRRRSKRAQQHADAPPSLSAVRGRRSVRGGRPAVMCVTEVTAPRGTTEIGTVAAPAAFSSGALMPPRPSARSALATALGAAGAALGGLAAHDLTQKRHTILRIYPVIGHMRYLLEGLRPEIQQYFIERNWDGRRSEEHTSELQSRGHLVCRLLLEKKKEHR